MNNNEKLNLCECLEWYHYVWCVHFIAPGTHHQVLSKPVGLFHSLFPDQLIFACFIWMNAHFPHLLSKNWPLIIKVLWTIGKKWYHNSSLHFLKEQWDEGVHCSPIAFYFMNYKPISFPFLFWWIFCYATIHTVSINKYFLNLCYDLNSPPQTHFQNFSSPVGGDILKAIEPKV